MEDAAHTGTNTFVEKYMDTSTSANKSVGETVNVRVNTGMPASARAVQCFGKSLGLLLTSVRFCLWVKVHKQMKMSEKVLVKM